MNTAIIRLAQGICLAIAVNTAAFGAGRPIKDERIARPLPRRLVRSLGPPAEAGVLGVSMEPNSPAHHRGLLKGGPIIGLSGRPIEGGDDLHSPLTGDPIGVPLGVTALRGTERAVLPIVTREFTAA